MAHICENYMMQIGNLGVHSYQISSRKLKLKLDFECSSVSVSL